MNHHENDVRRLDDDDDGNEDEKSVVSVKGYSLRAPNCSNVSEFAVALGRGEDLTTDKTRYPPGHLGLPPRQGRIKDEDIESFDPSFFKMSHKQAEAMDPLIRMLLKVSYEALLDAQVNVSAARGSRTGVYVGHCFSDVGSHNTSSFTSKKNGYELVNGVNSMAANRLSYYYDFRGPSLTIDTACSSSLVALHYAVNDLRSGVVDRAVVAGLSLTVDPHKNASFHAFRMLSPTGHCYAFDTRANGYCRSDGVACIILERRQRRRPGGRRENNEDDPDHDKEDVPKQDHDDDDDDVDGDDEGYAIITGTGTNSDGCKTEGITYPSSAQQARLMKEVFAKNRILPESVSYHEAHGTGTIAGDREELSALASVYLHKKNRNHNENNNKEEEEEEGPLPLLYVGSVKSNMGHAEGASGLMGLIKILIMFEQCRLFPNFDFRDSPHAAIRDGIFAIPPKEGSVTMEWDPKPCTISSFGFGGSNAFAILEPTAKASAKVGERESGSVDNETRSVEEDFKEKCALPFAASREGFDASSDLASSYRNFYAMQRSIRNHEAFRYHWKDHKWVEYSPLVFLCDGQGSQWIDMGKDLMNTSPTFRQRMERLGSETGLPLVDLYEDGSRWMQKEYSTIGIVSFQLGLIAILKEEAGIQPDYFLGHSLGELACAYLAGFATEADVLRCAMVRTKLVISFDSQTMRLDVYEEEPPDGYDYIILENLEDDGVRSTLTHLDDERTAPRKQKPPYYVKRVPIDSAVDSNSVVSRSFSLDGKMAVVGGTSDVVERAIGELGLTETRIGCYNAPKGQTISGPKVEVDSLLRHLRATHGPTMFIRELDTDHIAYHAIYLAAFREWLRSEFPNGVRTTKLKLPPAWKSTSRGTWFDIDYLIENLCGPVYFQEAIEALPPKATVVEIGPSQGLLAQVRRTRGDLTLIGVVERSQPTDLPSSLSKLKAWTEPVTEVSSSNQQTKRRIYRLPIHERYPPLWTKERAFSAPQWKKFELPTTTSTITTSGKRRIQYDLTKQPWSTLRDHVINGQNLFPAAGYMHALWSAFSFEAGYEMLDFRIHSPLVISSNDRAVSFQLQRAGSWFELLDDGDDGTTRYASASIQPVSSTSKRVMNHPPIKNRSKKDEHVNRVDGNLWYPDRRRIGYEYGPSYQLLDGLSWENASIPRIPNNWVAYLDGLLHLRLFDTPSLGYPTGFDRIVFWSSSLSDAANWVSRPLINTICNSTVHLEGLRMDYLPIRTQNPTLHREVFVEYSETNHSLHPKRIAQVIIRESSTCHILEPLQSGELRAIAEELRNCPFTKENDNNTSKMILSDAVSDACKEGALLLTVLPDDSPMTFPIVARWGRVVLCRVRRDSPPMKLEFVSAWEAASTKKQPFIWKGVGSSGAVASLAAETRDRICPLSYEGPENYLYKVQEKGMRQNYVLEDGRHGLWVDEDFTSGSVTNPTSSYARLKVSNPGRLDSLCWEALDPLQYEVRTTVATLNFRDVMRAMGRLKEEDLSLGLEFAGVRKDGQRVFGVAKHALSTHCTPMYYYPTPAYLTDEEAASIPVVYLTVYYALFQKANMRPGQSVLIHAGTGGVGMAAITLALKRGLKVFTTCSATKREYLKQTFDLSDSHIGDSRSDGFVNTVMEGTERRGVDVVLNQLAGPLQMASLRCLAEGGHFCEIGKYDILQNTGLAQALLASNISFHVIDLLPLLCEPSERTRWDSILDEGFSRKEIVPLPTTTFDASRVIDAFRFMSQGKHQGKIVVNRLAGREYAITGSTGCLSSETHLITGGLGGLGLALAHHLARGGASKVILVGRSGVKNGFQRWKIDQIKEFGCIVEVLQTDLLMLTTNACVQPDKIWHVATVYRDVVLADMTEDSWDQVVQTKVGGYHTLRRLWPEVPIVCFSSVVAYFGNAMQTSYASANAMLDAAAREDSNTTSIRLGPLDNVGFITKGENNRSLFDRLPFTVMSVDGVLSSILQITSKQKSGVYGIYDLREVSGPTRTSGAKTNQNGTAMCKSGSKKTVVKTGGIIFSAKKYSLEDAQKLVANVLGGTPDQYESTTVLKSAGLDSLSTMEVVHHVQDQSRNADFKPSDITDRFTLQDMIDAINSDKESNHIITSKPPDIDEEQGTLDTGEEVDVTDEIDMDGIIHQEKHSQDNDTSIPSDRKRGIEFISVPPNGVEFESIIEGLRGAKLVVFRQLDQSVFNHGLTVDDVGDKEAVDRYMDQYISLAEALQKSKATVVTVIEGEVRGGGMMFPAFADVCIATEQATFRLPEVDREIVPSIVSRALVERMGQASISKWLLREGDFDAREAFHLGLLDYIVDKGDVDGHIVNLLRRWEPRAEAKLLAKTTANPSASMGIIALEVYTPPHAIHADSLEAQGIGARSRQGQLAVAVWDNQEDSISMALTAVSKLLQNHDIDPYEIGRIEVGTESNVDMAKSIKSYLMSLLPLDHCDVEGVDNTNACYGGTAALLNTLAWCREVGKYAIVVATDTAEMCLEQSGWRGASAVAMLVGPNPWIEIHPERVSCFKNTQEFLKPRFSMKVTPYIQTKQSMDHYVHALNHTIDKMLSVHNVDVQKMDAFVFHGGLCATFMELIEQHLLKKFNKTVISWKSSFDHARYAASQMGGLSTASMYVNLVSLLAAGDQDALKRIGLFSYGFGSTATLLHATLHPDRAHCLDLLEEISNRSFVSFAQFKMIANKSNKYEVLDRKEGVFYRDLLGDSLERTYFCEGGEVLPKESSPSHSSRKLTESEVDFQRWMAAFALSAATVFWVAAVSIRRSNAGSIFQNAANVFFACCLIHIWTSQYVKLKGVRVRGSSSSLVHYALGVVVLILFGILYAVDEMIFAEHWSAIYFGYYLSDNVFLVTAWHECPPSYRLFYAMHHTLSFVITGSWVVWDGVWEDYIILGVMLWLTAEIWQYIINFYRHLPSTQPSNVHVRTLRLLGFFLERVNKIFAYLYATSVGSFKISEFAFFVLGCGLFFDIIDAIAQWKTIGVGDCC